MPLPVHGQQVVPVRNATPAARAPDHRPRPAGDGPVVVRGVGGGGHHQHGGDFQSEVPLWAGWRVVVVVRLDAGGDSGVGILEDL